LDKLIFKNLLLRWYEKNKRELPWRNSKDAYRIWLSEIILQQTRINQGLPYYEKFLQSYQDIHALARASENEVLRTWQGLGYYSRARNMLKCAKIIVERYQGVFPSRYSELIELPGIGPYTAAAIASISFDQPTPVIDGNVYRVLSRIFGIKNDIQMAASKHIFKKLAEELISFEKPGDYNQAIMEFGALHCTPVNPKCDLCLFSEHCYAYRHNMQAELPLRLKRGRNHKRYFHYCVIHCDQQIFMKKRNTKDIWLGLYDFPLIETDRQKIDFRKYDMTRNLINKYPFVKVRTFRHVLSHQLIFATFYRWDLNFPGENIMSSLPDNGRFYNQKEIEVIPKPGLIDKYLREE